MALDALMQAVDDEITDPEEETAVLFSRSTPSQNLGFVDPKAHVLNLTVAGDDFTIHQSPSVLRSDRTGGTTGAVLWKITPLFSEWIASSSNILFASSLLSSESVILELGCGVSGLIGLVLAPKVARYVLTDQAYVSRFVAQNMDENRRGRPSSRPAKFRTSTNIKGDGKLQSDDASNLAFATLDWETDQVSPALTGSASHRSFDAVIACDCIYNEALILPFVQTCVDACRLRVEDAGCTGPCFCIVGQQLRSPDVFEAWLRVFQAHFHVWQMPDGKLPESLRMGSGCVVHIGILKTEA